MSRPNTGSTTGGAPAGANVTWWAQSWIVSQFEAIPPAMPRAKTIPMTTRTIREIGVSSGRSSASRTTVRAGGGRRPTPP